MQDSKKPKNLTFEPPKKAEQVFNPELHSHPELMSLSEKLELGEEILSEILLDVLNREGLEVTGLDVEENVIELKLSREATAVAKVELEYLVSETTKGVFSLHLK